MRVVPFLHPIGFPGGTSPAALAHVKCWWSACPNLASPPGIRVRKAGEDHGKERKNEKERGRVEEGAVDNTRFEEVCSASDFVICGLYCIPRRRSVQ